MFYHLPFTRPSWIMTEVLIIFRIIFCPVPDFIRELPVIFRPYNHFDGTIRFCCIMENRDYWWYNLSGHRVYGLPESTDYVRGSAGSGNADNGVFFVDLVFSDSSQPRFSSSSAPSTGLRRAVSPHAISPIIQLGDIPKVGGISGGLSNTPPGDRLYRPPYKDASALFLRGTIWLTSSSICGIAFCTANATFWSSGWYLLISLAQISFPDDRKVTVVRLSAFL